MTVRISALGLFLGAAMLAGPASAAYTEVNIDSYVNNHVAINPQFLPIGSSEGNQGTGIPFLVSSAPGDSSESGVWLSDGSVGATLNVTGLSIPGQASFYALLNNYFGTPGADEYDVTITTAGGQSATYQSIGGVDTRDYNANVFTNTIANTTTEWYNNGIGQRYDVRVFNLPAAFAMDTITGFQITQVTDGDNAIFAGLTFSTETGALGVPEPATWAMMLVGFGGLGVAMRTRRRKTAAA